MNEFKRPLDKIPGAHAVCPRCGKPVDRLVSSGTDPEKYSCVECVKKEMKEDGRLIGSG